MPAEHYIDFKTLTFGLDAVNDLRYSVRGSTKELVMHVDEQGNQSSYYDSIVPQADVMLIWEDILNGVPLELPKQCEVCPEDRQLTLWRTFTKTALEGFKASLGQGCSLVLPPLRNLDGNDVHICDKAEVNQPGVLWTAKDSDLALSVGLSRSLMTGEPVTLLGFTLCEEDIDQGVRVFGIRSGREQAILKEFTPEELSKRFFGKERIVSGITERQIARGVAYTVDDSFFALIKDAFGERQFVTNRALMKLSCLMSEILLDLAIHDPSVEDEFNLHTLPGSWKPFLKRAPKETFKFVPEAGLEPA